jgi:hypothetical protein
MPGSLTCTDVSWSVSSTEVSAGSDDRLRFLFRRVAELTDDGGCALFAEGDRKCLAEVSVLGLQLAVSFGGRDANRRGVRPVRLEQEA